MDIVYLLKRSENNPELQFSLRSLKNVPHDKVHFVGYKPRWVVGANHIWCDFQAPTQEQHKKWHISWKMLRHACLDESISDEFILFNDDFFVMNPITEVPLLHRGEITNIVTDSRAYAAKNNKYVAAMVETRELLTMMKRPTLCYEIHTPMVIDKHKMLTAMEVVEATTRPGLFHINKRSFYANYWELGGEKTEDVKVDSARPSFDSDGSFLSTTEQSFRSRPVGEYIRRRFPDPSPYESSQRIANVGTYRSYNPGTGPRPTNPRRRNVNR